MADYFFNALLAAAATVEVPIDGQTGVWIKSGTTVVGSAMKTTGVTVSAGFTQYVYSRGVASGTLAVSGGRIIAGSGAVIRNASASEYSSAVAVSANRAAVSGLNVWNASATLSDCSAENIVVGTDIGTYTARVSCLGGNVSNVDMGPKTLLTLNGASAFGVRVSSGAYLNAGGSSYIDDLAMVSGAIGSAYQTTINHLTVSGGGLTLTADAVLGSLTTTPYRGLITVVGGSQMDGRTLSYLGIALYSGVVCSAPTLGASAACNVYNGAILSAPVLLSGGTLYVASGGSALAVTSSAGAIVTVVNGGYIEYA